MLDTPKLLYVLPDVAYLAELLPTKKPHNFTIHAFRQINGQFMDENEFLSENVIKLFSKLEPENYHLILPDFLFTNTIISIPEATEAKVQQVLKSETLPGLELTAGTHEITTHILTQHKGQARVQLSAIEKSVLTPIRVGASQAKINISAVSPISWTVKSAISLEPSVSVLQIGSMLYCALQYIGVDQTNQAPIEEIETIAETIKTLKGSEPNIQTIYLVANTLVEEKLKDLLSNTVPIQQLATAKDDDAKLPAHVKHIIECGMRTLSIADYPVPQFPLGKASASELAAPTLSDQSSLDDQTTQEDTNVTKLPKPNTAKEVTEPETPAVVIETEDLDEPSSETQAEQAQPTSSDDQKETTETPAPEDTAQTEVNLAQFAPHAVTAAASAPPQNAAATQASPKSASPAAPSSKPSRSFGAKTMLKMLLVTIAVFCVTVAIGIGVGVGLLALSNSRQPATPSTPVVITDQAAPSPTVAAGTASASLTGTPSAAKTTPVPIAAAIAKQAVLVVNATTKAGYAGTIKAKLEKAGFTSVSAGNAKGSYTGTSDLVLMATASAELSSALESGSGLSLTTQSDTKTEDPSGKYAAIVVLVK